MNMDTTVEIVEEELTGETLYDFGGNSVAEKRSVKPDMSQRVVQAPKAQPHAPHLVQGSPEWEAKLWNIGRGLQGPSLRLEATSRESIYGDDLR